MHGILHTLRRENARWLLIVLLGVLIPSPLAAQLRFPKVTKSKNGATTSRRARESAIGAIPFDRINKQVSAQIQSVIQKPTIYRRLPTNTVECDQELFVFLLRNPEVVVGIWDVMGATQISMDRTGPFTFAATDGAGTTSQFQLVYGTQGLHIFYGEGLYEGTLLKKKIPGRAVLVLRSEYHRDESGRQLVTNILDMFIEMDNVTVDAIAKTFRPVIGHFADLNFAETIKFVSRLSEAATRNGPAVQRMAGRLKKVSPPVREQFSLVAGNVAGGAMTARRPTALRSGQIDRAIDGNVLPASASQTGSRDNSVERIARELGDSSYR